MHLFCTLMPKKSLMHPQAVRSAVNTMLPDATVYEVRHCAYAKLRLPGGDSPAGVAGLEEHDGRDGLIAGVRDSRCHVEAGQRNIGSWELACKSGETGISWFA